MKCNNILAEGEGFEPSVSCPTPVFKTGSLNHSVTLPLDIIPIVSIIFQQGLVK